jgi:hypothetical protein
MRLFAQTAIERRTLALLTLLLGIAAAFFIFAQ